jgi:putative resolvase
MSLSIGLAAAFIGVSIPTLRRWEKESRFLPCLRTIGGHRRYAAARLQEIFFGQGTTTNPYALAYCRVSSSDQIKDLATQKCKLEQFCQQQFDNYIIVTDLGSGLH